jgi:hypothetical protein
LKKKKIQNSIIIAIVIIIIGSIVAYNYSFEQTKQKGLQFGIELEKIESDVNDLQIKFYSEKTRWTEEDISKEELLTYYEKHLEQFETIILKYDNLTPPEIFESSVVLLKLSSETQLESDSQFIEWIKTGDESAKIRSDTQIQEAYEYQNLGLAEFQSAKAGVKYYEGGEKFEAPKGISSQQVIQVSEEMKNECNKKFKNEFEEFDSDEIEIEWFNCINEADQWKVDHLP